MACRTPFLLFLSLSLLFLLAAATSSPPVTVDDDEDISFLEEPKAASDDGEHAAAYYHGEDDGGDFGNLEDFPDDEDWSSESSTPSVDEKDVVALNGSNFADFIADNKFVLVEFYAPWCGHCQALAPEYAAAATELKAEGGEIILAKVDAMEETELANNYNVEGFPSIYFFVHGQHRTYNGQRTKEGIISWLKKKTGPGVRNVTTVEEAEKILSTDSKIVVAYLDSLTGSESKEFEAASKLDDDVDFYQTASSDVAGIFQLVPQAKRPTLVLLKKEDEKRTLLDGEFSKSVIAEFVSSNKLDLVVTFTRDNAPQVFENPIKKQVLLFALGNESDKLIPVFQEASKSFKGKSKIFLSVMEFNFRREKESHSGHVLVVDLLQLLFVFVEMDNEDHGKPVAEYFGITGVSPKIVAYTGNEDGRKFLYEDDLTSEKIKSFAADFYEDKLQPFYKSEPIPEKNDGDVKVVVGKNLDEIVLDESKDALLEIYAPWCQHCISLEPIYNKLAKHLRGIDSIVIAKMDGTSNEHPRAKSDGFPTILFFPAGNKSFEPITFEGDRTVVELYKFLKKHASIPFKLHKPTQASTKPQPTPEPATIEAQESSNSLKDEL
ncbi:LOW QUALITY PROTEIN: hypothetical protein V2J09_022990 [Rumex salicifolius]